ncbi:MAG: DNA-binding transcriptional LysR family regulator [Granulosicoccus sp.]
MLEHGEQVEQAMRAATDALAGASEGLAGQIRIGAPDGCANYLLPQVCARITAENPDLDIQIVALPRVVNLTRREADLAIAVSAPTAGRLLVQKITDYKLHLVASRQYLRQAPALKTIDDLKGRPMIGYIPDMIFDAELDYLSELGVTRIALASNAVSVQLRLTATGAGLCVGHDFALPTHKQLRRVLVNQISLTRSFYLVRHQGDQRSERLNRIASQLIEGLRAEVIRLEALA